MELIELQRLRRGHILATQASESEPGEQSVKIILMEISAEIISRQFLKPHKLSEMIEWRLLNLKDVLTSVDCFRNIDYGVICDVSSLGKWKTKRRKQLL